MTRTATAKTHKAACDRLCREIVRLRGCCQRCLSAQNLEWAHIRPRRFVGDPDGVSLRTNPENAWLLCSTCHREVDTNQIAFGKLVEATIGTERFEELVRISHSPHRPWRAADWAQERARLRALLTAAGRANDADC